MQSVEISQAGQTRKHQRESDDRRKRCISASQTSAQPRLYDYQVDYPGYDREQLDRLSVPVNPVARVRPRDSSSDPQRQQNKANGHRLEADRIAGLERWQLMKNGAESLVSEFSLLNDVHQTGPKRYKECGISQHYQARVDWQDYPRQRVAYIVGYGRGCRHERRYCGQNEDDWKNKRAEGSGFIPPLSDNVTDDQTPGEERSHLLAADDRAPPGHQSSMEQPSGLGSE